MFDINTIKNLKCLICRQNLVELEDREDNKCLTKKDYKRYQYRPKLYFGGVAECFKFNKNKIKEINRIFK